MKRKLLLSGLLALALIFGLALAACSNPSSGDDDGGYLTIENGIYVLTPSGQSSIGVFEPGTSKADALLGNHLVAGLSYDELEAGDRTESGYHIKIKLYSSGVRWSGSGTYDVIIHFDPSAPTYYRETNLQFSAGSATINWADSSKFVSGW
jgi:hypothetical protein